MTLKETEFDVYRMLDDLSDMFKLQAQDKGLQLVFECQPSVPQYVRADEVKLREVLINLVTNAIKFTEQGWVAVRVACPQPVRGSKQAASTAQAQPMAVGEPAVLHFEVADSGHGIAPDEIKMLFEAFAQAAAGQKAQEGTGLGLVISQQFVRLMGGTLQVRSQVEHGTGFAFDVRVCVGQAPQAEHAPPARHVIALAPGQPRWRILVVDDQETNRRLLPKLLAPLGFEVREACNGQEALDTWQAWSPHVIFMDLRMPVMDGYEATRRIRATTQGQAAIIIALTASALDSDKSIPSLTGCNDLVHKPFHDWDILNLLGKHLGAQYIYQDAAGPGETARLAAVLTPGALAALPPALLSDLEQAASEANVVRVSQLVEQAHAHSPDVADGLAGLADDFEYEKIIDLIHKFRDSL